MRLTTRPSWNYSKNYVSLFKEGFRVKVGNVFIDQSVMGEKGIGKDQCILWVLLSLTLHTIYLNIKKIIIRKAFYLFCFFSMTFLQGLGIWPLILFFTSLLWQLSCKAWHSKKKSVWAVEMYYFLGLGRLEMSGDWLPSHLCWLYWRWVTPLFVERWIGKKRRNAVIWFWGQWHGCAG